MIWRIDLENYQKLFEVQLSINLMWHIIVYITGKRRELDKKMLLFSFFNVHILLKREAFSRKKLCINFYLKKRNLLKPISMFVFF